MAARMLLWVDCTAGAIAGISVIAFHRWLSGLYSLPEQLILFLGVVNLLYGSYSFTLARHAARSMAGLKLLVFANAGWALVCLGLAVAFSSTVSAFGIAHLVGEALFVGALATMEWRRRNELVPGTSALPSSI